MKEEKKMALVPNFEGSKDFGFPEVKPIDWRKYIEPKFVFVTEFRGYTTLEYLTEYEFNLINNKK